MAQAGDRYYKAVTHDELEAAKRGDFNIRLTPTKPIPDEWLPDVANQRILSLAGGGARQGPLLAAAGAHVTVFDLSERQVERDRDVAARENLNLTTTVGDMRDLSALDSDQYDLIVSPCATCFCPSVDPIWPECFRVLKPGGELMIGFINPLNYLFDAVQLEQGKFVVRHQIPYSDLNLPEADRAALTGPERPLEFGHSLESLIGGQLKAGFHLVGFFEDGWAGNDPLTKLIPTFACTRVRKP